MITKVLGVSQPAMSGVIRRSRWVIIITWPLKSWIVTFFERFVYQKDYNNRFCILKLFFPKITKIW